MTGAEIAQILFAAAAFVTALGGMIVGIRNTRTIQQVKETGDKSHDLINSKMSQFIEAVRAGATDRATLDERAKVKADADAEKGQ